MDELANKVIMVTGASRGLGEAMAVGYAEEGAALVVAARTASDLERVADQCRSSGAREVLAVVTDITRQDQVQHLVDETIDVFGSIDVFVANAGVGPAGVSEKPFDSVTSYDLDAVQAILATNVVGTWLCMKAALPVMKAGASFIVIGSATGRMALPGTGIYGVSKSAVDMMTRLVAAEVRAQGITVNCLSPGGAIETAFFGPQGMPEALKAYTDGAPASIMVPAAVWLASDDARDISGAWIRARLFNKLGPEKIRAELGNK